ncbi:hypothetical protein RBSWK_04833 [Rhodopirellula baltica SWK14]|uniref:Uncharacterized protein n=1 Tax=Rhodopirellula baltica SWK14 TaxID=993516 RepID=L7CB92_RHOBT|nr:hypothetical protein RBSWK_04833 [Rhodopirellula baltica SWK14]
MEGVPFFRFRFSADFPMAYLSRNFVSGEVERRRSGVREGEGQTWETARTALPGILAERSHSAPP